MIRNVRDDAVAHVDGRGLDAVWQNHAAAANDQLHPR